ncbi:MAG: hypothetical protein Q9172_006567, partial [Xanthocarpia lactea]
MLLPRSPQGHYEEVTDPEGAEPNGYLQWDEVSAETKYIARTDSAVPTPALENLFMRFTIPKGEGGTA